MKQINHRGIGRIVLVLLLFLSAFALMIYPFVANYVFENRTDSLVQTVEESAEQIDDGKRAEELELARRYNEMIASGHIQLQDPFVKNETNEFADNYDSLLCMTEDGVMGFIKIPSIDVSLPIYHGTDEYTLEVGAGHLQGTSLPIGGTGTHSVITGHTGLSNAKLFTDLSELEIGDIFLLSVYGENLAYEIDQIKTVLPYELEDLAVDSRMDFCTLLTCTPYGVNTHRLLVRGQRTDYQEVMEHEELYRAKAVESKWMQEYKRDILISSVALIAALILYFYFMYVKGKKNSRKEHIRNE